MVTEEQIKILAYSIWEQEGRPEGKHLEHYFRAKMILEKQEQATVIELPAPPRRPALPSRAKVEAAKEEEEKPAARPRTRRTGSIHRTKKSSKGETNTPES